jgi:hypothetical protein
MRNRVGSLFGSNDIHIASLLSERRIRRSLTGAAARYDDPGPSRDGLFQDTYKHQGTELTCPATVWILVILRVAGYRSKSQRVFPSFHYPTLRFTTQNPLCICHSTVLHAAHNSHGTLSRMISYLITVDLHRQAVAEIDPFICAFLARHTTTRQSAIRCHHVHLEAHDDPVLLKLTYKSMHIPRVCRRRGYTSCSGVVGTTLASARGRSKDRKLRMADILALSSK